MSQARLPSDLAAELVRFADEATGMPLNGLGNTIRRAIKGGSNAGRKSRQSTFLPHDDSADGPSYACIRSGSRGT